MDLKIVISDDPMQTAIIALQARGFNPRQTSEHQLKLGSWNFWPSKGTITRDGQHGRHPESGLEAFVKVLDNDRTLRRK